MPQATTTPERIELAVHRSVRVLGVDDRPAAELTAIDGAVTIALLPRNGSKRSPVRLADLDAAVAALKA